MHQIKSSSELHAWDYDVLEVHGWATGPYGWWADRGLDTGLLLIAPFCSIGPLSCHYKKRLPG